MHVKQTKAVIAGDDFTANGMWICGMRANRVLSLPTVREQKFFLIHIG